MFTKRVSITVVDIRPRQFAKVITSALTKKTIDAFGGIPADSVHPGDLINGLPIGVGDPDDGSPPPAFALPAEVHFPDDPFLRAGDTIFEVLTLAGGVYSPSLSVDFYRDVWFDGLSADKGIHFTVTTNGDVDPISTLDSDVSVTAKYVLAG